MDVFSSSKVTVEYHDPSGVFPLLSPYLLSYFPLRNLHWKSPSRPLRSIDSLHVDLVPSLEEPLSSGSSPTLGEHSTSIAQRLQSGTGGGGGEAVTPQRERRHQIPGLRQTPYLKVYLLRCDDSETYKTTSRKLVREWLRSHTPPSQSSQSPISGQENHDAFEWLILHVVLPDTQAANQPRWSGSGGASTPSEKSNSRWTRGSTTIYEKIRTDFQISSKSAPDRIAQIRLPRSAIPASANALPPGPMSSPLGETAAEQNNAWNDLIAKFKILILASFDLRVREYEENIREKDSQRSLPGWNFCTFFVLKEGLARGFESVGLVEDALIGYDELSVGLDAMIREVTLQDSAAHRNFLQYTEDLIRSIISVKEKATTKGESAEKVDNIFGNNPISSDKKNYRELILSNNISAFDFRCYIFSRQFSLLLRLGNAQLPELDLAARPRSRSVADIRETAISPPAHHLPEAEDLGSLAELCRRTLSFIPPIARVLRDDIWTGLRAKSISASGSLVDNFVYSWTVSVAQQVLTVTATSSLPISIMAGDGSGVSASKMRPYGGHGSEQKANLPEPKTMMHPARKSSLLTRRASFGEPPYSITPASGQVIYENNQQHTPSQPRPVPRPREDSTTLGPKFGLDELATRRAELYLLQRRVLEQIGKRSGWSIGWSAIASAHSTEEEKMTEISLTDNDEDVDDEGDDPESWKDNTPSNLGLVQKTLAEAATGMEQFRASYERLSDLAVKHYTAAGKSRAGESILGDLAAVKFELGDFAAAAMYFSRMAPTFGEGKWNLVETIMLKMYARCLKKLNRKDEYARTLLELLAKSAAKRRSSSFPIRPFAPKASTFPESLDSAVWLDDERIDTVGYLKELVTFSEQLPYDISVPVSRYFGDTVVEPHVQHLDAKDGFKLRLRFRHLLEDEIPIDTIQVRLAPVSSGLAKEIWLETKEPVLAKPGLVTTWVCSNVTTFDLYTIDKIVFKTQKIVFVHEPFKKTEEPSPLAISATEPAVPARLAKNSRIFCYSHREALQATIIPSRFIEIDGPKHVEIEINSGRNTITHAEIRLKSGTAGLRLRTADATVVSDGFAISDKSNAGIISFSGIEPEVKSRLRVPYDLENRLPGLSIGVEVIYHTEKGEFHFYSSPTIPVELPLDVNVLDHFKGAAIFSRFNIKTATKIPLEVSKIELESSDVHEVRGPQLMEYPMLVFPKQPASITYRITRKHPNKPLIDKSKVTKNHPSMNMTVDYHCLDEVAIHVVEKLFVADLKDSPFLSLERLLIPTFLDRLRQQILPNQYERLALTKIINMTPFEQLKWHDLTESVPSSVWEELKPWLKDWYKNHKSIPLLTEDDEEINLASARQIRIKVLVPRVHIVHTVSLRLLDEERTSNYSPPVAGLGRMIRAELSIVHTRQWDSPGSLQTAAKISSPDDPIDFVYRIDAEPDSWLIGGPRKAHFSAKEGEVLTYPMILMPLRTGNVLLPTIDIVVPSKPQLDQTPSHPSEVPNRPQPSTADEILVCEVDYRSQGEMVTVIPDVQSTTVGLLGPGEATVLSMSSKPRTPPAMTVGSGGSA